MDKRTTWQYSGPLSGLMGYHKVIFRRFLKAERESSSFDAPGLTEEALPLVFHPQQVPFTT